MKKVMRVMTIVAFVFAAMAFTTAKAEKAEIKVNGRCDDCKVKIEKAVKSVEGVETASWDVATKILTVNFDEKKTNVKAISTAIAKIGYDAGEVKADKQAKAKRLAACKEHEHHHGDKGCSQHHKSCNKK